MLLDREKLEDEYIKMYAIVLNDPPDSMRSLFTSAVGHRKCAVSIYNCLTADFYSKLTPLITAVMEYADPELFEDLAEKIKNSTDAAEIENYKGCVKEFTHMFVVEGQKFNEELASMLKSLNKDYSELSKNIRVDLTSDVYFYGKVEKALQVRGKQIAEMAEVIKNVYIAPMNTLKGKIKKYDDKIDDFIDPQKSFDNFMKALPTADEFASLSQFADKKPDTQVEAMKAVYSIALKGITFIGNEIVNVKNMEERRKLQDELDSMVENYDKYKGQYEKVISEYNMVKDMVIVLNGMTFFADIASKVSQELEVCTSNLSQYLKNKDVRKYKLEVVKFQKDFGSFLR